MMSQLFILKWNNHMNNAIDTFKNLLSTEEMVDVTLTCEGHYIKAHKIILSACSPFFHSLFLEIPSKHPIVILKDMKYTELKAIIEFIYHGEVNVAQENLSVFLEAAQTLQIKGLTDSTNENVSASSPHQSSFKTVHKRRRVRSRKGSVHDQSNEKSCEPTLKPPLFFETEALSQKSQDSDAESSTPIQPNSSPNVNCFHNQYQQQEQKQVLDQGDNQNFPVEENTTVMSQESFDKQPNDVNLPMRSDMPSIQSNICSTEIQDLSNNSKDHSACFIPKRVLSNLADPTEHLRSPCIKTKPLELLSSETLTLHDRDHGTKTPFLNPSHMLDVPEPSYSQDNSTQLSRHCQTHDNNTGASEVDAKTLSSVSPEYKETNLKGLKRKSCSYCSYSPKHSSNLKRHIRYHTGERPYTCSDCNKKFFNSSHLVRHMRIHTRQKPYECHFCDKQFNDKSCLAKHMRIHTGEPYASSKK